MPPSEIKNEPLSSCTTFRIGGPADRLVTPPDRASLLDTLATCLRNRTPCFVLGRGSNVLFSDAGFRGVVIRNTAACNELDYDGETVTAGSSVPLQTFIRFCHSHGLHGMEYLYSVPGNIGGAVVMNAGRGESYAKAISDHILSVDVFDGSKIRTITRDDCGFSYRTSIFQQMPAWVILGARFRLPPQDPGVGARNIEERMAVVREQHDLGFPNAGTIFKKNFVPLPEILGKRIGGAAFSVKTPGWIVNVDHAKAKDVLALMAFAQKIHRDKKLPAPIPEVVVVRQGLRERLAAWLR
ncbi:UDP-N-acetylmuramate dehydrogenase [Geobacter sp.]|uniref:UDP-N-acetylmuramate dehydrogenase n=1 Tax=Geobacter sp. TaxID=46610 RepID=UPI0027B8808B|nr:FAD-binding protein [Geobacter sp.]